MLYDVRFETGDVIHRIFKFLQLLLLAAFAAFAGRFDVYYGFPNDMGLDSSPGCVPNAQVAVFEERAKPAYELGVLGVRRDKALRGHDTIPSFIAVMGAGAAGRARPLEKSVPQCLR